MGNTPIELNDQSPPRGFQITTSDMGDCMIRYRTAGMGGALFFLFVWLVGWTAGCVIFTAMALFNPEGVSYWLLVFMIPFWAAEFFVIGLFAWYFFSRTNFTFESDQLVVQRSFFRYHRQRVFPKKEIAAVKQVKDSSSNDQWLSWGLVIMAGEGINVLSRQPIDKSDWLGPIIARWAEVPYEPAQERQYKTL